MLTFGATPSITTVEPAPTAVRPPAPPALPAPSAPPSVLDMVQAAEAKVAELLKQKETTARWVALTLSGIASLFGIWRAVRKDRC